MTLENVKVGDYLAVYSGGWTRSLEKVLVSRATKTTITAGALIFNRKGYVRGGGSWSSIHAEPWNEAVHAQEYADAIRARKSAVLANRLRETRWKELPLETLLAICGIVEDEFAKHNKTDGTKT